MQRISTPCSVICGITTFKSPQVPTRFISCWGRRPIVNDHVAFRTYNLPKLGLEKLAAHFLALGYEQKGEYVFKAKLYAKHFEHKDPDAPKVFISELKVEELSDAAKAIIHKLAAQVPDHLTDTQAFLYAGAPWQVSWADYQTLLAESEYAAWMAAWGYRANHFTVNINRLKDFDTIQQVNTALKAAGFVLNGVGGEVKGDPQVMLGNRPPWPTRRTWPSPTVCVPSRAALRIRPALPAGRRRALPRLRRSLGRQDFRIHQRHVKRGRVIPALLHANASLAEAFSLAAGGRA